jgi:hypothetical protein
MKCEHDSVRRSGDIITLHSVCSLDGRSLTTEALIAFEGEAAYHVDLKEHADPPIGGISDLAITQDAKWIGPCSDGMKPGDVVGVDGPKE